MSCDPEYICCICMTGFEQDFNDRDKEPICPSCGSADVMLAEVYRENERINAQEAEAESGREL